MKTKMVVFAAAVALAGIVSAKPVYLDGGRLLKPKTGEGKIVLIDTQSKVDAAVFREAARVLMEATALTFAYESKAGGSLAVTKGNVFESVPLLKRESGATAVLVIVDDAEIPALVTANEDFWGVLNVRKLALESDSNAAYQERCGKEAIRALAILCGGGSSIYPNNILGEPTFRTIDAIKAGVPVDRVSAIRRYLKPLGVTECVYASYEQACEEGWAPSPTNDVQRKIWNDVHTPPKNPITIKHDPKKGR